MPIKVTYQNPGLEYDEKHGMRRFSEYGNVASRGLISIPGHIVRLTFTNELLKANFVFFDLNPMSCLKPCGTTSKPHEFSNASGRPVTFPRSETGRSQPRLYLRVHPIGAKCHKRPSELDGGLMEV